MNKQIRIVMCIAIVVALLPTLTASAALPANLSWVKSTSNPVVPTSICATGITPARPAVLVESANHYNMYFTTHPGASGAQIYLATTTDGGLTWACGNGGNPVLTVGAAGAWDGTRVTTPTVVKDGPNDYKMWYTGRNASAQYAIGYATSTDGVSWTKSGSNPVLTVGNAAAWDSQYVREPAVVNVGGTYHMWYSGTAHWPYFRIGHATSPDGIVWTKDAANPVLNVTAGSWDSIEVYAPSVVMNGAVYEMFYSGNSGGVWLTGHASSNDGVTWTKDGNAIISPSATGWDNGDSTDYVAAVLDGATWKVFYSGAGATGYQIGLATLTNQAQLTFKPLQSSVAVGGSTVVTIDLTAVTNLYGYQFQVSYDQTRVSATGAFVNSFFDTTSNAIVPPTWNAVCGAGTCRFAVTKMAPGTPSTGSGTLAQITFTGVAPGLVPLTFSSDILTDRDANAIPHSSTVGYLNVNGTATLSGVVNMQGRATPIDAGTVTLYDQNGYLPPTVVNFSAVDGTWSATVPVQDGGTTYDLVAAHGLYLSNRLNGLSVASGGSYPQATTRLLGGDANNSGTIDIGDLSCIGSDFGTTNNSCTGGNSNITADGIVNILDLVLAGGNFGLSTPQPW